MMLKRILPLIIFYTCLTVSSYSTTYTTVKTGTWTDTSIWDLNTIPSNSDTIIIKHYVQAVEDVIMYAPGYLLIEQSGTLCGRNLNLYIICGALFDNYGSLYVDSLFVNGLANNYGYIGITAYSIVYGPCSSGTAFYSIGGIDIFDSITCNSSSGMNNPRKENDYEIKLAPNPANEDVILYMNLPSAVEISLHIYDIEGRIAKTLKDSQILDSGIQKLHLNIYDLPPGIYLLHLVVDGSAITKKLVKTN